MHGYMGYEDLSWGHLKPKAKYAAVMLADAFCNNVKLSDKEQVITYGELINQRTSYNPNAVGYDFYSGTHEHSSKYLSYTKPSGNNVNSNIKNHIVKLVNNGMLNAPNGAVFCSPGSFKLIIFGKSDKEDLQNWVFFNSMGLNVYLNENRQHFNEKTTESKNRRILQSYNVSLKANSPMGHIQFFQSAIQGTLNTRIGEVPYGTILNYFVYPNDETCLENEEYPAVLSVLPRSPQTYVSLRVKQILQIVVPRYYTLENPNCSKLAYKGKCPASFGKYDCYYFECVKNTAETALIFFTHSVTKTQGVVIVTAIEEIQNVKYSVLHSPSNDFVIYNNEMPNILLRTNQSQSAWNKNNSNYLDKQSKIKILGPTKVMANGCYDLRLQIMEREYSQLRIKNLLKPDATATIETT